MAARGYVPDIAGQVGRWYGGTITGGQAGTAAYWLEAAEHVIDTVTGRTFGHGGTVTERYYAPAGPVLFLRQRPVASVGTVAATYHGSTAVVGLVLTDDYTVDDLARGRLWVRPSTCPAYLTVTYVPGTAVPQPIQEATAALLADWLANSDASSGSQGPVVREKAGDVEVQYADVSSTTTTTAADLPPRVQQLLAPYLGRPRFA